MIFNPPDKTRNHLESNNREQVLIQLEDNDKEIYVLGTNSWAKSIDENFKVQGFIDDFSKEKKFLNKDILKIEDLDPDSIFISSNVLGRPLTALKRILDFSDNAIDYFTILKKFPNKLKPVLWVTEFESEYLSNKEFYQNINTELADDYSKYVLKKLLNFRLTGDLKWMQGFTDCQHRQYFEPFLDHKKMKCFYDIGCFDGYTSCQFALHYPDYEMIEIFEPSPNNILSIEEKLKDYKNIKINNFCASNINGKLRFSESGSASNISDKGELEVNALKIDDADLNQPSYIKMDIEGGEMAALEGMQNTIEKYKPVIAISVYHKASDIREIFQFVKAINKDYKVYLRHYTEGITETVMFFV
tara:strand:- start:5 stop:1081 length:1077 start_codon:yes stop_codon:yes gene_type:complete